MIERNATTLFELDLHGNQLSFWTLHVFSAFTALNRIRKLDLSDNNLSQQTCGAPFSSWIADIISFCTALRYFKIDNNGLTDTETFMIANRLQERETNNPMRMLSIVGNNITNEGIKELKRCQKNNKLFQLYY